MKILVTTARMPYALDEIRKFGRQGHEVYATDTFNNAAGNHSKYVKQHFITASPRLATKQYINDLLNIINNQHIDILIPACEEVFYIVQHIDRFPKSVNIFAPDFENLVKLHNKVRFFEFAQQLGIKTPKGIVVNSREQLLAAIKEFDGYIARRAYSRAGLQVLTNVGPLSAFSSIDQCHPTPKHPWLVQEFIHGTDVCSFSIVKDGQITAHSAYIHPNTIDFAGGIIFESVQEPYALEVAKIIAETTQYTGQLSFDFMKTGDGQMYILECNPRPTHGVVVMSDEEFVNGVFAAIPSEPVIVQPGKRKQLYSAILRDMCCNWRNIPTDLKAILSFTPDIYFDIRDLKPVWYQFMSYSIVFDYRRFLHRKGRGRDDLVAAQFYDISWDGES